MTYSNEMSLVQLLASDLPSSVVVGDALSRIAEREPLVGAWQYLDEPGSRRVAGAAPTGRPLDGIPVGVKDMIDTADMPTEYGSAIHRGRRPDRDAWSVGRLRALGAIILGKTVTTEFGGFSPGKTRNPHDLDRTPGGSSSGSAAAVADGMVPLALGSQTAGSTIRPAAFCGVASHVISRGTVPTTGMCEMAASLDTLGVFARNVPDLAVFFGLLTGRHRAPRRAVGELTLLCCDGTELADIDPDMAKSYSTARAHLAERGATCREFVVSPGCRQLLEDHHTIMVYELARARSYINGQRSLASEPLLAMLDQGAATSDGMYHAAVERVAHQRSDITRMLVESGAALLLPAAVGPALTLPEGTGDPALSRPWHAMGMPAVAIPGLRNSAGLPLGLQVVGAPGTDSALLETASVIEDFLRA